MNVDDSLTTTMAEGRKRQRGGNTTQEQYEIYLRKMEEDPVFRSGIVNPTTEEGYLQREWEVLASDLNAVGNGPVFTAAAWKKRFQEWKNAVRHKYRTISASSYRTGGGPQSKKKLSDLEDRGIAVWGRVTLEGSASVTVTGGLASNSIGLVSRNTELVSRSTELTGTSTRLACSSTEGQASTSTAAQEEPEDEEEMFRPGENIEIFFDDNVEETATGQTFITPHSSRRRSNPRRTNEIGEALITTFQGEASALTDAIKMHAATYREIEILKLKFEVAKYKFEHAAFKFDEV